jgi:hypothetical protein
MSLEIFQWYILKTMFFQCYRTNLTLISNTTNKNILIEGEDLHRPGLQKLARVY